MNPTFSRTVRHRYQIKLIPTMQLRLALPLSILAKRASSRASAFTPELIACRYHNYAQYLANWTDSIARGTGSNDLSKRPLPVAMLYDNTTIQGSWISVNNVTEISKQYSTSNYSRIVINVTMAMPHAGVIGAMRDPINRIMQPQDLEVSTL